MNIFFDGIKKHIIFEISIIATFCIWPDGFKFLENIFAMLLRIYLFLFYEIMCIIS
jgi:hypothetical protein